MENMDKRKFRNGMIIYLLILIVAFILINRWMQSDKIEVTTTYSYTDLTEDLDDGKILALSIQPNAEIPTAVVQVQFTNGKTLAFYSTDVNDVVKIYNDYQASVDKYNATVSSDDDKKVVARCSLNDVEKTSIWSVIIPYALVMIVMFFVMLLFVRSSQGGGGQMMNFGKSRAKMTEPDEKEKEDKKNNKKKITFDDVAGLSEEKEDLEEIVCFLKNPGRFIKVGARIPKGVLLVGPPGTGKTLMAKAIAGEAGVPFFSISGSDFVEMFVGVGASRVRDLFRKANNMAPCIIFIDEIDAIGGKRDTRHGGGDSEREQTLNQLLSEMDGFDSSKGIIVLAATNRPEVLDKALLRPGRFDRRIIVSKPDMQGRIDTLKVHSKNVKMDETVDFKELALATSGAVGADLANIINEAALMAVRNKRDYVSQKDLIASVEVVFAGKEKKEKLLSPREKKIVAYHEVGHALVAALQKNTLPIQRITIVPRTSGALGYVWQVPEEEKQLQTKKEMEEDIVTFLAGRAAEELKFDSVTNGASNDIEKATSLARTMITMYGMSEKFGMVQLEGVTGEYLDNRRVLNCSSETETKVDTEVKNMMKASYEKAYKLLKKNMPTLDAIAQVLYEKENLSGKEFMELYEKYQNVKLTEAEKVQ